jgi:RNA-binding protein
MTEEPEVSLHVGKQGLTDMVVGELRGQLKKRGVVKVRLLRSAKEASDRKGFFETLARRAGARLVKVVGYVAVYERP